MNKYLLDKERYVRMGGGTPQLFVYFYRKSQAASNKLSVLLYRVLFKLSKWRRCIDLYYKTEIGEGIYFGHAYCITINPCAKIGKNCNIHKGVTIGQTNRGPKKGVPIIGDCVWIGVNATVVGGIKIGDDVLIAPNAYVNVDVPSHSLVFGNPCVIKHRDNATEGYVDNRI